MAAVVVTAVAAVPIVVIVVPVVEVAVMVVLGLRRSGHDDGLGLLRVAAIPVIVLAGWAMVVVVAVPVAVAGTCRRL